MYSKLCSPKKNKSQNIITLGCVFKNEVRFLSKDGTCTSKCHQSPIKSKQKTFITRCLRKRIAEKGGHPKKPIASISPNQEPMLKRPLRVPGVLCRLTSPSVVPEHGVSPTSRPPRKMIRISRRGTVASEGQELTSSDKTERMRPLRVTS